MSATQLQSYKNFLISNVLYILSAISGHLLFSSYGSLIDYRTIPVVEVPVNRTDKTDCQTICERYSTIVGK